MQSFRKIKTTFILYIWLKYGFCKKPLWKVLGGCNSKPTQKWWQICSKSVQLVRGSSLQSDFLQNPYFSVVKMQQHRNRNTLSEQISSHCDLLNELFSWKVTIRAQLFSHLRPHYFFFLLQTSLKLQCSKKVISLVDYRFFFLTFDSSHVIYYSSWQKKSVENLDHGYGV